MNFQIVKLVNLLLLVQFSLQYVKTTFPVTSKNSWLDLSTRINNGFVSSVKPNMPKKGRGFPFPTMLWGNVTRKSNSDLYSLQESFERSCYAIAARNIHSDLEKHFSARNKTGVALDLDFPSPSRLLQAKWFIALTKRIRQGADSGDMGSTFASTKRPLSPAATTVVRRLVSTLGPELMAIICLQELTRISSYDTDLNGVPAVRLADAIGRSLHRESITYQEYEETGGTGERFSQRPWAARLVPEVGMYLVWLAINSLNVTDQLPNGGRGRSGAAFRHVLRPFRRIRKIGVIEWDPVVHEAMLSDPSSVVVEPWTLPMLVPPKPWRRFNSGGYLLRSVNCVRLKSDLPGDLDILRKIDSSGRLNTTLLGLNALGRTPWRVNNAVLRVALHEYHTGMVDVKGAPLPVKDATLPSASNIKDREVENLLLLKPVQKSPEKISAFQSFANTRNVLEIARQFAGLTFYQPHSVDFRGRAYPIPSVFTHLGNDLARGLLVFGRGKALGARGLFWLKVHLANMFGIRGTLAERVEFTEKHMDNIVDSADFPLAGNQWWKGAASPWQCLAACTELANAMRSQRPEDFVSHIPCQQDGSCNGLQHYAALGKDREGAIAVNVIGSERPQDVYGAVAKLVSARIETDALRSTSMNSMAMKLVGKINDRRIFKHTVMTSVYGVTPFTAKKFIESALDELKLDLSPSEIPEAAQYLTKLTFESLSSIFTSARNIQKWLGQMADEVVRSVSPEAALRLDTPAKNRASRLGDFYPRTLVSWTTPIGFQVTQSYRKHSLTEQVRTALQTVNIPQAGGRLSPVNKKKQVMSFAANFIQSLDAAHMFKTALACSRENITFASVHDSFWTHPCDVDRLNQLLRMEFVDMYTQQKSILDKLAEEFEKKYGANMVPNLDHENKIMSWRPVRFPSVPKCGLLDISDVLNSTYFFH